MKTSFSLVTVVICLVLFVVTGPVSPVSAAAVADVVPLPPIGDLTPQVVNYVTKLQEGIADLDGTKDYVSDADSLVKDATALTLVALAIGLTAEDSLYKKAAPAIIQACKSFKTAKTYAEGKAGVETIANSIKAVGNPAELKWEKIVSIKPAMKVVPNINSTMNRNLRSESILKRSSGKVREGTAAMAVIVQGAIANADETINPTATELWKKQSEMFRDIALETNKMVHDFEAGTATFDQVKTQVEKMTAACDQCHEHFVAGGKVAATE